MADGNDLVSLKDILEGDTRDLDSNSFESYIQVSNNLEHQDGSQPSDKDR